MRLVENRSPKRNQPLSAAEAAIAGVRGPSSVREFLPAFPAYQATPLESLPNLAADLGVGGIDIKDESGRYGLGAFKALGGAYAVARLVRDHAAKVLGRPVAPVELLGEDVRKTAAQLTVCCATDGNHGRSVAAGAQMFGCRCVIFLHGGVSAGREKAIASFGAEIRRTPGNYDQSVAEARETGEREGWTIVSDFASEGYTDIPGLVMQGYTLMLEEISRQARQRYSHIFVQGGVGGLAAVVAGYFLERDGADRPKLIVVEPAKANCLQASAAAGRRMAIPAGDATVMAMLECYEPSLTAWGILEKGADFYIDVDDGQAVAALQRLARPVKGDPALRIGESGVAGLAGLMAAMGQPSVCSALGLNEGSRILLVGTEGATDPDLYEALLAGEPAPAHAVPV